jgi:NAD-dependent SIR2 family protein deacetylase
MNKICRTCKKEFNINQYYHDKHGVLKSHDCKKCHNKISWIKYSDGMKKSAKKYGIKIRLKALEAYSGKFPKCSCCGEDTIEFLGIDHVDGGGNKHRKELTKNGTTLYLWLNKNNYPKGYQVLCHNCNLAKGYYGECPHKKIKY